jgi:hypothetical protein
MEKHPGIRKVFSENDQRMVQIRSGPIDTHHLEVLQTQNAGQKTLYYDRGLSFPEIQRLYAEATHADPLRTAIESFPLEARNRRMNTAMEPQTNLPTFTHATGWYKEAIDSATNRYGRNRLLLDPERYARGMQ